MGIRHATGSLQVKELTEVCISDIHDAALENARQQLSSQLNMAKARFCRSDDLKGNYDIVIIASTASGRMAICIQALQAKPSYVLIEKPLGQSLAEVKELVDFFADKNVSVSVNLNMRMYPFVKQLKNDLQTFPQFAGIKSINYQGGTLGIGANGIHYLDLLFFLFNADRAALKAGEIEPDLIPSGRGSQFGDFGGWACIKFYNNAQHYLGRSLISLSSSSTVFGGWDIIGSHGRIRINELEAERVDILRKPDSALPVNRYAGDYQPSKTSKIESPFLGDLTREWVENIIDENENLLPSIQQSLKVHELMFNWLQLSKSYQDTFPIT